MPPISSRLFRRAVPVAAVVMAIVLGGCAKKIENPLANTGGPSGTSGSGASSSQSLSSLSNSVKAAETAKFKAVYTADENGNTSTVTIEQAPPKSLFSSGQGLVVNTGTATYFCSTGSSGSSETCVSESSSTNPLGGLAALFSPATAVTALEGYQSLVAARVAGVNVSYSSASYAGQDSTCVTVSRSGQTAKYCVTKSGILAFEGSGANSFQLTSYSATTSDSDFSLPAGATVESIPSTPNTSY